ncbi:YitT family protein [Anaerosphaera multitolerans]|uniref:YitT family protein n=1 Tax=Anaerosphaera multitolerans TaxID=2487351 RepID=A0A437S8E9_9FIRM|nr:YitT family protein [Anaerosphaera multitolerans]RVU55107.1 YitT family protein [Anaerosphaera multitolerans]
MAKKKNYTLSTDNFKKFLIVTLGVFILSTGLYFFTIPNNLAAGGVTGISIIVSSFFQNIPISFIILFFNIFLNALGIIIIGREFGAYTIYASLALSFFLRVFEIFVPLSGTISDDLLINLIFGMIIQGAGISLVINAGASTGGTDILGKILEKYTRLSFGSSLALIDGCITLGAILNFGPTIGMYSLLGVVLNSTIIDKLLQGFNSKYNITIISEKLEEINTYIIRDLYRGSTIYNAEGGYSSTPRKILTTIVDRKDYIKLRSFVKAKDEHAFMFISHVSEVEGEGFTYEKKDI